jgi:hypothetical protein
MGGVGGNGRFLHLRLARKATFATCSSLCQLASCLADRPVAESCPLLLDLRQFVVRLHQSTAPVSPERPPHSSGRAIQLQLLMLSFLFVCLPGHRPGGRRRACHLAGHCRHQVQH